MKWSEIQEWDLEEPKAGVELTALLLRLEHGRAQLQIEIGNLLPNIQRQRCRCYALCHILYPVSAALTSIFRMDSHSTSYANNARHVSSRDHKWLQDRQWDDPRKSPGWDCCSVSSGAQLPRYTIQALYSYAKFQFSTCTVSVGGSYPLYDTHM